MKRIYLIRISRFFNKTELLKTEKRLDSYVYLKMEEVWKEIYERKDEGYFITSTNDRESFGLDDIFPQPYQERIIYFKSKEYLSGIVHHTVSLDKIKWVYAKTTPESYFFFSKPMSLTVSPSFCISNTLEISTTKRLMMIFSILQIEYNRKTKKINYHFIHDEIPVDTYQIDVEGDRIRISGSMTKSAY